MCFIDPRTPCQAWLSRLQQAADESAASIVGIECFAGTGLLLDEMLLQRPVHAPGGLKPIT